MVINEHNVLDLVVQIEHKTKSAIAADRQDAECLAANAVDQLDGMLRLLGAAGVEVGGKPAWERVIAAIQAAQDRLRLAAAATTLPHPTRSVRPAPETTPEPVPAPTAPEHPSLDDADWQPEPMAPYDSAAVDTPTTEKSSSVGIDPGFAADPLQQAIALLQTAAQTRRLHDTLPADLNRLRDTLDDVSDAIHRATTALSKILGDLA